MRYDSARLADFSDASAAKQHSVFDGPFFLVSMLLLAVGVIMVFSSSYARAWYDPGNVTGETPPIISCVSSCLLLWV